MSNFWQLVTPIIKINWFLTKNLSNFVCLPWKLQTRIAIIGNQNIFDKNTHRRVIHEHAKYDDILQADMVDHYNNLTLKSVFTLKFFLNESNFNSPPPFHMMKIDNDVYLNVPQLKFILNDPTHLLKLGLKSKSPMYMIGHSQGTRKKPPKRNGVTGSVMANCFFLN